MKEKRKKTKHKFADNDKRDDEDEDDNNNDRVFIESINRRRGAPCLNFVHSIKKIIPIIIFLFFAKKKFIILGNCHI